MPAPILPFSDIVPLLPSRGALIGLDLGTKTIGLALSDLGRRIATPLETIRRRKFSLDVAELLAICEKHAIAGMIIGLPLNMDGSEGPRAQATRAFVRNLVPLTTIPIACWDERLSTTAVTRTLLEADTSRAKRAEVVDKMAASFILQGALDRMQAAARAAREAADEARARAGDGSDGEPA